MPRGTRAAGGGGRGTLSARLAMADRFAQSKLASLLDTLDMATDTDQPAFGGGHLTRPQFRALLGENTEFQRQVLARLPFTSDAEKASLRRELDRLLPAAAPATTTRVPALPIDSVNAPLPPPTQEGPAPPFGA